MRLDKYLKNSRLINLTQLKVSAPTLIFGFYTYNTADSKEYYIKEFVTKTLEMYLV